MGRKRSTRRQRRRDEHEENPPPVVQQICWLCRRPLGSRVEWHHPLPKSRGGRDVVPVHPICHRTIHASFTNKELEDLAADDRSLGDMPEIARFLSWIANKPPEFSAPTRRRR